jgi:hypothetical protein
MNFKIIAITTGTIAALSVLAVCIKKKVTAGDKSTGLLNS